MANFRRRYPRTRVRTKISNKTYFMNSWPKWWDIVFHTQPKRRVEQRLLGRIIRDDVDADAVVWPLGNHKPHAYFW